MREIRFKVWDIKRKRMLDSECIVFNDGDYYEDYRDFEDGIVLNNIVVTQYTGLKDKNGVEIFEGDVVDYLGNIGIVDFALNNQQTMISSYSDSWIADVDYSTTINMRVLGNVYENKDLVK